jgi:cell division protein FtsL
MDSQENPGNTYGPFHLAANSQLNPQISLYKGENADGTSALLWIAPKTDSSDQVSLSESNFIETLSALPAHLSLPIIEQDPTHPPSWVAHRAPNGQSINDFTTAVGKLDLPTTQSLFIKFLGLVQDLHTASFYHGNLSPETIFIGENGIEIAPSYEVIERQLNTNSTITPQKWISNERILRKQPSPEEDVQAIVLLFVFVLGGIRNPDVVNRTDLLNQASKYLSTLQINESCREILLSSLTETHSEKSLSGEVMWAIKNLKNSSTEEIPVVTKAVENYEAEQLEPPSPTEFVATSPQRNIRPTKKNLIYSAVSIVYIVTVVLLIVAKSDNSSLNSEVKELNGQIDSLESDNGDKDNTISSLEVDLSNVLYDLDTANSTIDVLQQPQSTYFDYDGSWSLSLNGDESCKGWASNNEVCALIPKNLTISSGSTFFDGYLISTITDGYSTLGGYFGSSTDLGFRSCNGYDYFADITMNMTAIEISPSPTGIIATVAYGDVLVESPSQRGCDATSISFSFTATR